MSQRGGRRWFYFSAIVAISAYVLVPLPSGATITVRATRSAPPGAPIKGASTLPAPTDEAGPRSAHAKAPQASFGSNQSRTAIIVKFSEGSGVRQQGQHFTSPAGGAELAALNRAVADNRGRVGRGLERAESDLDRERSAGEARSGRQLADLNLYFVVSVPTEAEGMSFLDAALSSGLVETAYGQPLPAAMPPTPDFSPSQGYRSAPAGGIGATTVASVPGARGSNVAVADIEYSWNVNHEDLSKARAPGAFIPNGTPVDPFASNSHGTAVLGEMIADDNGIGVTGLVPEASLRMVNANNTLRYDIPNAVSVASAALSPGDVILIEQQTFTQAITSCSNNGSGGCVPVEYWPLNYDAIVAAVASGKTVVEAAGNGADNLDTVTYDGQLVFNGGRADSGAIVVGAGNAPGCTAPARGRRYFSTYGARVDVHGWGECVVTTGYGDLQNTSVNATYTSVFAGTSSASPIVASSAASVSSAAQAKGVVPTPEQIRRVLRNTGSAQVLTGGALTGNIGALPNLTQALPLTDNFAQEAALTPGNGTLTSTNLGGSSEVGEPNTTAGEPSSWWRFVAPADGTLDLNTLGSDFDTFLHVYTGSTLGTLTKVAENDDTPAGQTYSIITGLPVRAGTTYHVRVKGYQGAVGSIRAAWNYAQTPQTISGVVTNDGGNPLANAYVTIDGSSSPAVVTNSAGGFVIPSVAAGSYSVRARRACSTERSQTVAVSSAATVNFQLPADSSRCSVDAQVWDPTSTVLPLTGDDASTTVALPFTYAFYGTAYSQVHVSTNGHLNFLAPSTVFQNTAIPNPTPPNAAIYGFWDDLVVDASASVLTATQGSAPNRRFVVEWRNVKLLGHDERRFSFQVVIYENTSERVRLQYRGIDPGTDETGTSATVGKEDAGGTKAVQISNNTAALFDGLSIRPK